MDIGYTGHRTGNSPAGSTMRGAHATYTPSGRNPEAKVRLASVWLSQQPRTLNVKTVLTRLGGAKYCTERFVREYISGCVAAALCQ
jgi:hypothetical protein